MIFLGKWRMPLLFLISGAGTYYALGKRTAGQYLGERLKRLMLPFLAGIFILVPVQVYLERTGQYASLLDFYPHMFEGVYPEGNFSWHHLWFILYLFFISLCFSPFIPLFRGKAYRRFLRWLEGFAAMPLSLNIIAIFLVASQLWLRPHYPDDTHALFNDWAAMAYYIIFFLSGFILLSSPRIVDAIQAQRRLYLGEALITTGLMFALPRLFPEGLAQDLVRGISSIFMAWSCGMAAIGYGKQYLNRDRSLRKLANEAIYPFYLLHQPVILLVGYFLIRVEMPDLLRFVLLTVLSFGITTTLYWFLVRPFNLTRVIFGMKPHPRAASRVQVQLAALPKD